jgi:hypothetical protein
VTLGDIGVNSILIIGTIGCDRGHRAADLSEHRAAWCMEYDVLLDGFAETIFVTDSHVSLPWQPGSLVCITLSETGMSLLPGQTA